MHPVDFSVYDYVDQPIFVLVADSSNRPIYHYVNPRACREAGRRREDSVGRAACDVFSGRSAYALYQRQCDAWDAGKPAEYEIVLQTDHRPRWLKTRLLPIHDQDGVMTHMVGSYLDITHEQERLQEHALSIAAAHEMEDLMCMAAHDLRSPIGNLKSLAEVFRKDFIDHGDGKKELINLIDVIADKTLSVISQIMVQAMATNEPESAEVFDLGALCDDILIMLDPMRQHNVTYPSVLVETDHTAVHIILRNLIDNACKHSMNENAQIEIEVDAMNPQRLLFVVRDDGPGFSSSNPERRDAGQQTGFGLPAALRLAHSRGGQITIMPPKSGRGAEVRFEFPGRLVEVASEFGMNMSAAG
jgi:signal transduction histidine kinase